MYYININDVLYQNLYWYRQSYIGIGSELEKRVSPITSLGQLCLCSTFDLGDMNLL